MTNQSGNIQHGQFLRIEKYAVQAPHGKQGGNNIFKVAQESMRVEGYCPHVAHPMRPRILFGINPIDAAKLAQKWSEARVDQYLHKPTQMVKSRKPRSDKACATVGVISVPPQWRVGRRWDQFCEACLAWLQNLFGDRVASVLEHLDEHCLHMHFWVIPKYGESFGAIHPGEAAIETVGRNSSRLSRDMAFKKAMSRFLDDFYRHVGLPFGFERETIGAARLSREQWSRKILLDQQREAEVKRRIAEAVKDALEQQAAVHATKLQVRESEFVFQTRTTSATSIPQLPSSASPPSHADDSGISVQQDKLSFAITKASPIDDRLNIQGGQMPQWIRSRIR